MKQYVMALDSGTTSNRCILFDHSGNIVSVSQREFTQHYPRPGWVEHDAQEIWGTQIMVANEALKKVNATADQIASDTVLLAGSDDGIEIDVITDEVADLLVRKGEATVVHEAGAVAMNLYILGFRALCQAQKSGHETANNGDFLHILSKLRTKLLKTFGLSYN